MLSAYNMQLRNIGRAKVCPTNPTVGMANALPAHYVPTFLVADVACCIFSKLRQLSGVETLLFTLLFNYSFSSVK